MLRGRDCDLRATSWPSEGLARPQANRKAIATKVVGDLDGLMQVFAIRSAVFIEEQDCPYAEEFDGNDFCALHLLGFVDGEPVGCARLRFFAGFAKLERVAVRKIYRSGLRLAFVLARDAIDLARRKGYTVVYGHARDALVPFWRRLGFKPLKAEGEAFAFSDHRYVEMVLDCPAHPEAVRLGADPYVTLRPEGRWDGPGILEHSALRDGAAA